MSSEATTATFLPTICFRLSSGHLRLIRPVLCRIRASIWRIQNGWTPTHLLPADYFIGDSRHLPRDPVLAQLIVRLWWYLHPKFDGGGRLRIRFDFLELCLCQLCLRTLDRQVRHRHVDAPFPDYAPRAARLLKTLEKLRKQAKRLTLQCISKEQYTLIAQRWRQYVHWIRACALGCRCGRPRVPGKNRLTRLYIPEVIKIAEREIRSEGFVPPDAKVLRKWARLLLRNVRRGREGKMSIRQLLTSPCGLSCIRIFMRRKLLEYHGGWNELEKEKKTSSNKKSKNSSVRKKHICLPKHPDFLRLNRSWEKLPGVEKGRLMDQILSDVSCSKRELARALKKDDRTVAYNLGLFKSEVQTSGPTEEMTQAETEITASKIEDKGPASIPAVLPVPPKKESELIAPPRPPAVVIPACNQSPPADGDTTRALSLDCLTEELIRFVKTLEDSVRPAQVLREILSGPEPPRTSQIERSSPRKNIRRWLWERPEDSGMVRQAIEWAIEFFDDPLNQNTAPSRGARLGLGRFPLLTRDITERFVSYLMQLFSDAALIWGILADMQISLASGRPFSTVHLIPENVLRLYRYQELSPSPQEELHKWLIVHANTSAGQIVDTAQERFSKGDCRFHHHRRPVTQRADTFGRIRQERISGRLL